MIESSKVWESRGSHSFTQQTWFATIAGFTMYGLIGTAIAAQLTYQSQYAPAKWELLLIGLIVPLIGILIAGVSRNWFISFLGYNLVIIPFGVILAPVLREYDAHIIRNVAALTALITATMGLAGSLSPAVFQRLGSALFFSLLALVMVRITGIFIPQLGALRIIDYIAAGIFSLYIGYDMYRASVVQRTLDNAIDIALSLYLDIINLFLNLLKIFGDDD